MIDLTKMRECVKAVQAHDLRGHYAMNKEYTDLARERDAGVTPARREEIRLRLNRLRALGRVSSAQYRAKCNAVRAERDLILPQLIAEEAPALMARVRGKRPDQVAKADQTDLEEVAQKMRDAIVVSLREDKTEVDRTAWQRKPVKS